MACRGAMPPKKAENRPLNMETCDISIWCSNVINQPSKVKCWTELKLCRLSKKGHSNSVWVEKEDVVFTSKHQHSYSHHMKSFNSLAYLEHCQPRSPLCSSELALWSDLGSDSSSHSLGGRDGRRATRRSGPEAAPLVHRRELLRCGDGQGGR